MAVGQCLLEQIDFARGQRVPKQGHLQWVVTDLAFVLVDILHHFVRMDNRFGFEEYGGGGDAHDGVERANQGMSLRQAFAAGTHLLPDEGYGVHTQDVHAQVGEEHHFARHGVEYPRIGVIQIPLERVEGRPYPAAVFQLREAARMLVGEDFAQGAVVLVGHPAVGEI